STGGNVRGYWADQLDPKYLVALGSVTDSTGTKPILISAATSANVAKAQSAMAGLSVPASFVAAATANPTSSTLTMAKGLTAFPQYSGVSDLWGSNSGNLSYHSLQITLLQRLAHGLTFNINYTYSKNIGDDGTFRSGFNIPGAAISGGGQDWHQDRIERSWTGTSVPQNLHAFGVWNLPFGKDHLGGSTWAGRTLAGGWQLSGIYTLNSGSPMAVTSNLCTGTNFPNQGQCMPDLAPGATSARINGSYGTGPNGTTTCNLGLATGCQPISYVDTTKFKAPATNGSIFLIGNAPRTQALNLRNPGTQNFDAALHRKFALPRDIGNIVVEVDCINVWNKVTMNGPAVNFGASGFGTIGGASGNARDFQFAGHFNF
ncbi:MAG: carboxypeptidase regulatory-like domain-containing protein, partial [Acidobacteriota bacterium]|nr:carboxypeptidase regulatory-like domain-containing protein [Acidobacteriota bacterium]